MIFVFQPDLIERVVFHAVRSDGRRSRQYQREFAACYEAPSGDDRDHRFQELHERWFCELGFRDRITSTVTAFPNAQSQVARFMMVQAGNPNAQSAELFGEPGRFTVVVTVAHATFLDVPRFDYWIRHELLHIDDMLDPAFHYDRGAEPTGPSFAAKNLGRDRYALLWAISIDARLAKQNHVAKTVKSQRGSELSLAWGLSDLNAADQALEQLWTRFEACRPTHHDLLDLACATWSGGSWSQDRSTNHRTPSPGDPCPVCKFNTFDWALQSQLEQQIRDAVRKALPVWRPEDGLCGRCAEVYALEAAGKAPAGV